MTESSGSQLPGGEGRPDRGERPRGLTLVLLAAGLARRYGAVKQLESLGPRGETLMQLDVADAVEAGFERIVAVVREEIADAVLGHLRPTVPTGTSAKGTRGSPGIRVETVVQRLHDLPDGFSVPAGRTRPWGTVHALLTARREVKAPFAVANADDYYGRGSWPPLVEALQRGRHALVAYPLRETLPPAGWVAKKALGKSGTGVSRAICEVRPRGKGRPAILQEVVECVEVRRVGGEIRGRPEGGTAETTFRGDEPTSMNLWGFQPSVFERFERGFARFLERHGLDLDAEYGLSTAVSEELGGDSFEVEVIETGGGWLGITHPEDREWVRGALASRDIE